MLYRSIAASYTPWRLAPTLRHSEQNPAAAGNPRHDNGLLGGAFLAKWNPSYDKNAVTTSATTLAHTGTDTPCTTTGRPIMIRARWPSAIRRNTIPAVSEYACSLICGPP